ncbi:MAG: Eco57I restriction-modification methylase domain-containing protein [Spirochaetota bacterium]
MDDKGIGAIEKFVAAQRALLRADVEDQLHGYGIQSNGELLPESSIEHLPDDELLVATQLRQRLLHLASSAKPNAAVQTLTREQAFTTLNRIVALRMAEARGIILPAVSSGMESEGFQLYQQNAGQQAIEQFLWYREYLFSLYDELSLELPRLFDRFRGEGLVFPRQATLQKLIDAMAAPELEGIWDEDETIGWMYQYFNDPKERKKLREKGAPSDSYELAVRNQFFTPRYVVEFLVDNSLGRLWAECTQNRAALDGVCDTLAMAPDDVLSRPEPRDPQNLAVIDPACGSMHFGLYTFDVLASIYLDAWNSRYDSPWTNDFVGSFEDENELRALIPKLICERNLFGVDIDSRAIQIAGMTLWLRAHRWWQEMGLDRGARPTIRRFNLATAQPMPGEQEFYAEFLETLSPKSLQKIAGVVWEELKLAGEVGSLLKVERSIAREVKALRDAVDRVPDRDKKQIWFASEDQAEYSTRKYGVDLSEVHEEDDWAQMEQRVFEALEAFARARRTESSAYQRSMFADDTHAGFAFLDVLRRDFDVVLMNPPFGASATKAKGYITKHYPRTKNDLYAAFVEAFLGRLRPGGYLGAITSRTGFFLSTFTKWREEVLLQESEPVVMADLGFGVLDAMVETAAYVLRAS